MTTRRLTPLLGSLLIAVATSACAAPAGTTPATESAAAARPSALDAELFYQLLLAEMVRREDPGAAYSMVLEAAQRVRDPALFRRAVEIALQGRAGNAALDAARAWISALPQDEEARRTQVQLLLALQRSSELGAALRDWIRAVPAHRRPAVLALVPAALAQYPNDEDALAAARAALEPWLRSPDTAAHAWAALGRVQAQRGQRAAALQSARQALQADPKAASAGQLAIELIEPQRGPADELVQAHLQALPAREAANVRVALARALVERDRSDEAEAQLQQAIDADPQLADAWLLHGLLLTQRQAREPAQRALQQYLALTEANADAAARGRTQALLELADLATAAGQLDEAQRWLDRIRDGDALLSVQIRRAQQLALRGQLDAARNLLRDTPTNNADERLRLLIAEARLLRDHDQAQTAYELLQQAHAQQPGQRELQYELAMMAERVGALAQMEQLLRELIARFPEDAQAYNALGYALADRGLRLDEAKALIEQALQRAPNDAYIIDSLGWVEYRLGNLARARELLQDAMRRRPDPEIAAHLGEVLWTMGEREQAVRVWRQGLALDARHRVLLDTMARHGVRP